MASAAAIAAIIGVCPAAGALVEASTTVLASVFPKRHALYQSLFNVSVVSVGALAAGLTYRALGGPTIAFGHRSPLTGVVFAAAPMLVATTAYFVVNTAAVAKAVALASGASFTCVWERNFKTTLVAYTSGGACAILILGLSGYVPITPLLLLIAPIVYATYSREQTDEARIVALEKGKERLQGLYLASIRTLALTVAAKDPYTNGHNHRVTSYSTAIGRRMGLTEDEITDLETGALLHDIGKIGVPEHILTKPGKLDTEEMALMRRHSEIGWAIIEPLDFPDIVKQIVRCHHESCDGSGYPDGLSGAQIPLLVRIVTVSDVFDALTTHRPYRAALSIAEARRIMCGDMGPHFDRSLLTAFFKLLEEKPLDEICRVSAESPALMDILHELHPCQPFPSRQQPGIDRLAKL
ncbi:MAG TPA: HD-GYP domain-containing protein [Armatimonadota bacterium]